MARVLGRIQTRPFRQLLDDARNVDARQWGPLHLPMAIKRTEQWAAGYPGLLHPFLKNTHRTRFGIRAIRYSDLPARSILIRLGPAQRDRQTVLPECAIPNIQPHQLRPPERSS